MWTFIFFFLKICANNENLNKNINQLIDWTIKKHNFIFQFTSELFTLSVGNLNIKAKFELIYKKNLTY